MYDDDDTAAFRWMDGWIVTEKRDRLAPPLLSTPKESAMCSAGQGVYWLAPGLGGKRAAVKGRRGR